MIRAGAVRDHANVQHADMVHARKAQRQESVSQRNEKVVEIMNAQNDSKTFHKLINFFFFFWLVVLGLTAL